MVILLIVFWILIQTLTLHALPQFVDRIPNGRNIPGYSRLGHLVEDASVNDETLNHFGRDFRQSGFRWTIALCQTDSDGDGLTNGVELGDQDCKWTMEHPTPLRLTNLTHPGFSMSKGNEWTLWVVTHAVLMALAFGFCLPIGALFPAVPWIRRRLGTKWFRFHVGFQTTTFLLSWIGIFVGIANKTPMNRRNAAHFVGGVCLMILFTLQFLVGLNRPHPTEEKSAKRIVFECVHSWMGRILLVFSAVQLLLGYMLIANESTRFLLTIWAYIHVIAMPLLWFIYVKYYSAESSMPSANTSPRTTPPPQLFAIGSVESEENKKETIQTV